MNSLIDFSKLEKKPKGEDITPFKPRIKQSLHQKIKSGNKGEIGTKDIVIALSNYYRHHRTYINNCYVFNDKFENDFVTVYESLYVAEIEIKVSRSDFSEDFSGKPEKHKLLAEGTQWELIPNKFYYCAPRGLLLTSMIPPYAGLMEAVTDTEGNLTCNIIQEAPFIHKQDVYSKIKDRIFRKLAWRYKQILMGNLELLFTDEDTDEEINFVESKD